MKKVEKEYLFEQIYEIVKGAVKEVYKAKSYVITPMIVSYLEDYTPVIVMGTHHFAITHRAYIEAAIYMLYKDGFIFFNKAIGGYCLSEMQEEK